MSNEPTTIRDALEGAIEEVEQIDPPTESLDAGAPEPAESSGPARDDNGRFAPKAQAAETPVEAPGEPQAATEQQGITPGPKSGPRAQEERAPASWSPETRQHWNALPPDVRQEVMRREREVQTTLQETAEARRAVQHFQQLVQPYERFIREEQSTPLQAMVNMFDTAAKLRTGSAHEVAQLVAGVVQQYGVGRHGNEFISALDSALAGRVVNSQQSPGNPIQPVIQQVLAQELAPVRQFMGQMEQMRAMREQQVAVEAQQNVQQFIANQEFGADVASDMADILELAARQGRDMSLEDAYNRAVRLHPSISKIVSQREQASSGAPRLAQRARAAASSVSGSAPVGMPQQSGGDIRSAIEAAIEANSR